MLDVEVAVQLRLIKHDIVRVSDIRLAQADDKEIIKASKSDNRILLTLDEDFGDWAILPLKKNILVL